MHETTGEAAGETGAGNGAERWQGLLERTLGASIETLTGIGGGDFARAWQVRLDDGRPLFVKTHASPPPGFFSTEAAGLRWLGDAGAVAVPAVLLVSDDPPCLALEWIESGRDRSGRDRSGREQDEEAAFGRALAALHAAGADVFGRLDERTTGSLAVPNIPAPDWPTFYAERRLLPLARIAAERRALPAASIERLERVATRLDEFGASDEAPSRLHGDLWAGNRVIDVDGRSWLVDPAAHGGHREFDLAMMRLFGGFGERCHAAYREVTPLAHEWEARVPLHQLAPLVVHAIKFGGGYVNATGDALDRCL